MLAQEREIREAEKRGRAGRRHPYAQPLAPLSG